MRASTHGRAERPQLSIDGSTLRGEPFTAADWPLLADLFADRRTGRWLLRDPDTADIETHARSTAERFAEAWASDGLGPFALRLGARLVGYAGLKRSRIDCATEIEAVFAILSEWQGAGRATAALRAVIDAYDLTDPTALHIASWTLPENAAALRVMEKLGFRYERDSVWAGKPHTIHRLPAQRATAHTRLERRRAGAA